MDLNWVALTVAILGSAGVGGIITSTINGIVMARKGIAGREDQRRNDIVQQRDSALARAIAAERAADVADARADGERVTRIKWQETAARLRLQLITAGIEPQWNLPFEHKSKE